MNTLDAPKPTSLAGPCLEKTLVLKNTYGLHARPCALLIKKLRPFHCEVTVSVGAQSSPGDDILGLLMLAAGYDSQVHFRIEWEEAAQAMAVIQQLFDTRFGEAYATHEVLH